MSEDGVFSGEHEILAGWELEVPAPQLWSRSPPAPARSSWCHPAAWDGRSLHTSETAGAKQMHVEMLRGQNTSTCWGEEVISHLHLIQNNQGPVDSRDGFIGWRCREHHRCLSISGIVLHHHACMHQSFNHDHRSISQTQSPPPVDPDSLRRGWEI